MSHHFLPILFLACIAIAAAADPPQSQVLLKFKQSLSNTSALSNWDTKTPVCNKIRANNWAGVLCDRTGRVWGLQLENMGLRGQIDINALTNLPNLRTFSVMGNNFGGNLPEFWRLSALKTVYLSHNNFSGEIGEKTFAGMRSLKKLHLAYNKLSGQIPATLAELPRLIELTIDRNELEGKLPSFPVGMLKEFNASGNNLSGEIPEGLRVFNASLFSDNKELCGPPLNSCSPTSHNNGSQIPSIAVIIATLLLVFITLISLLVVIIVLFRNRNLDQQPSTVSDAGADIEQGLASISSLENKKHHVKLSFLSDRDPKFDMADLLKASAEHLSSGEFGNSYKAELDDGKVVVVVKKFKHMTGANRSEFNEHMKRLGRLNHRFVHPILAYYYRKEEKLLVTTYAPNQSLAVMLHGNRSPRLDWPTRLSIVKGIAKGLTYLHDELPSLAAPHGNLKSSNVLLDGSFHPILADYGLIPVTKQEFARGHMVAYKSPENKSQRQISRKSDVWSLGILILEIVTGRKPEIDMDLAAWVEAVMMSGSDVAVLFDKEMTGTSHAAGEMMKLLKLGLRCSDVEERRPEMRKAAEMIEEIKEMEEDEDFYSSCSDV